MATLDLDIPNHRLVLAAPQTVITIQEIHDQARAFSDDSDMMGQESIVVSQGKFNVSASGTLYSGIYLTLRDPWRLWGEDRGAAAQIVVDGGTLLAQNSFGNDPIEDSANVRWQIRQSTDSTLLNFVELVDIWTRLFGGKFYMDPVSGAEVIRDALGAIYSQADVFSDDGVTPYDGSAGVARRDDHVKP